MPESPELLMMKLLEIVAPPCLVCDAPATRVLESPVLMVQGVTHFCDAHGAKDSKTCRHLTEFSYVELDIAPLVRRCLSIRVMPDHGSITECEYHGAVEGFCQVVNERLNIAHIREGSTWVRVRPPSREELDAIAAGVPRLMPFTRPGSLARVVALYHLAGDGTRMVDIDIGGDTASYDFEAFTRAFIRAVDGSEWHVDLMRS